MRLLQIPLSLLLVPALVAGQTNQAQLSGAARRLLQKPRLGDARLTFPDGRKEDGQIVRVTDQFVTFAAKTSATCSDVELSKIADVHWLRNPMKGPALDIGNLILFWVFLAPVFLGYAIADPFRGIHPPLRPLRGTWESIGDGGKSSLELAISTVRGHVTTLKHGRYSVEANGLHLMLEGATATTIKFHFQCRKLIMESPARTFSLLAAPHHVAAPIAGEWSNGSSTLNFKPNGAFEERTESFRNGTFERTAMGVNIRWPDSQDWTAQIEHRHIVVHHDGLVTKYRYVPSGPELDF